MKKPTLYVLIGELRERSNSYILNKQFIIDFAIEKFSKFLNSFAVIEVCEILKDTYNSSYSLEENLECAIEDYIELSPSN